jgi:dihydrofolate synthase/folylpolyglutamate synthase
LNYRQTLEMLERRGNEVQKIRLGLHRASTIMEAFDNPHLKVPTIHIAGTNGKGSVAAMTEAILRQGGWKTGMFTSPHLERVEERIQIANRRISARGMAALATRIRSQEIRLLRGGKLDQRLTYFEFVTACAFLHFAAQRVDLAVVEVGLGGQLDATNIVAPQVCVITGVSIDHQTWLGDNLALISKEKAGVIKPCRPVISGCQGRDVRKVIRSRALQLSAPLMEIDRDCRIEILGFHRGRYRFDLDSPLRAYRRLRLSLAGRYQVRNAALAVSAVEALGSFPITARGVRTALSNTRWPGRLDEYHSLRRTLLEGGHNPEGARQLREFLQQHEVDEVHLVFGVLWDKDAEKMGRLLFPRARSIHLCPIQNTRSADPAGIAALHSRFRPRIRIHGDSRGALRAAWRECPGDGLVVVTGSLYLLGELLPLIRKHLKE